MHFDQISQGFVCASSTFWLCLPNALVRFSMLLNIASVLPLFLCFTRSEISSCVHFWIATLCTVFKKYTCQISIAGHLFQAIIPVVECSKCVRAALTSNYVKNMFVTLQGTLPLIAQSLSIGFTVFSSQETLVCILYQFTYSENFFLSPFWNLIM